MSSTMSLAPSEEGEVARIERNRISMKIVGAGLESDQRRVRATSGTRMSNVRNEVGVGKQAYRECAETL